jgi:hypothetical protein
MFKWFKKEKEIVAKKNSEPIIVTEKNSGPHFKETIEHEYVFNEELNKLVNIGKRTTTVKYEFNLHEYTCQVCELVKTTTHPQKEICDICLALSLNNKENK